MPHLRSLISTLLLSLLAPFALATDPPLQPLPRPDIHPAGDLARRTLLNLTRLTDPYYSPDHLLSVSPDWPGDAPGRELLALTLLSQSTHTDPPELPTLLQSISTHLNPHGYLGPVLPPDTQNEQTLSGHSWLLRGLCEYQLAHHDPLSLSLLQSITTHLLLPAAGHYATYPLDRPHTAEGQVAGNITRTLNHWQLSSDVGCAFILLDGATQTYDLSPSQELESLIKEMISRFSEMDLIKVRAQTHATLSALRGILRFYHSHPDPSYLSLVQRTYALYFSTATTEHYANYNWFTRPEWTEACAVVDSYMLATQLFAITRDPHYLEDAQLIYYNALSHAQRPNGGFGCDLCTGANPTLLSIAPHQIYEAPFCCSMRGAEGLTAASTYAYLLSPTTPDIYLPTFHNSTATLHLPDNGPTLTLLQSTSYPDNGSTTLTILSNTNPDTPLTLHLFLPSWIPTASLHLTLNDHPLNDAPIQNSFLTLTHPLPPGTRLHLTFSLPLRQSPPLHPTQLPSMTRYFHGPLLLATTHPTPTTHPTTHPAPALTSLHPTTPSTYQSPEGLTLTPLRDLPVEPTSSHQLLFPQ